MRQIHQLLGDSLRDRSSTIDQWVAEAQPRTATYATSLPGTSEAVFEYACALLYDSRLNRSIEVFQFSAALARMEDNQAVDVLSKLGHGRALNFLRRYRPADKLLSSALTKASQLSNPLLLDIAQYLSFLNQSDAGHQVSDTDWLFTPRSPLNEDNATDLLLEALRVYVCSRICLRSSQRQLGLNVLEGLIDGTDFNSLNPLMQGLILRMRGILLDVSGRTDLARVQLKQAIDLFCSVGFRLGEVQAALSLARTHSPTDRKQTKEYLDRARQILDATEPPTSNSPEGRHMPAERADLYSRLGDFAFAEGQTRRGRATLPAGSSRAQ